MKGMVALMVAMGLFFGGCTTAFATQSPLVQPVQTTQPDITQQLDEIGAQDLVEGLPDETTQLLRELGLSQVSLPGLLALTPAQFFKVVWALALEKLKGPVVTLASVMGVVVLCALLEGSKNTVGDATLSPVFQVVAVLCVSVAVSGPVVGCILTTVQAIKDCANFLLSFIPVMAGVMTVGGQPLTGATYNLFLFWACQLAAQFTVGTLTPLLGIYMAFSMVGAVMPGANLKSAASLLKTVITWTLGVMVSLFVGLMTIQSLVASSGDTVATKATKFMIGSFVPVVGSAISDAFMAAQGCIHLLKTTLGSFGVLAAALLFLPTLLQVIIWYLSLNLTCAMGDILGVRQVSELLKAFSSTLGILISVILCFVLMVITTTTIVLLLGVI